MIQLTRIFIVSLLVLSCSKKVKYIDREININVVPLPKKVEVVESNKYILLPKKIKVFIDSDERKNLFDLISKDFALTTSVEKKNIIKARVEKKIYKRLI